MKSIISLLSYSFDTSIVKVSPITNESASIFRNGSIHCYALSMTTSHDGDLQTFDEALGFTVQQYLFAHGVTRVELGKLLHVPGPSISNRLRGRIRWSAEDVAVIAARFGVGSSDLMPVLGADGRWVPAPFNPGYSASASMGVAPAGAGAASSHLRESNSRPIHYE